MLVMIVMIVMVIMIIMIIMIIIIGIIGIMESVKKELRVMKKDILTGVVDELNMRKIGSTKYFESQR